MQRPPSRFIAGIGTRTWPAWARYGATLLLVAAALLLRRALDPVLPADQPFLLSFAIILLVSWLFDHGAGLFATLLAAAFAAWFYMPPLGTLEVEGPGRSLALVVFVATGAAIAFVVERLHHALAELRHAYERLARSEAQGALLLREFRHRTRNDLQSLAALLLLRARAAPSQAAREGLREAAEHARALARVHAWLAHEGVTAGDDPTEVDARSFVEGLCRDLSVALTGDGLRPIALAAKAQSHPLDAERAVHLGLALNELVTNALKYAFPDERPGTVRVSLLLEGAELVLTVADDGVGLEAEEAVPDHPPEGRPSGGLGTRLLRAFAAQLRGGFSRRPGEGGVGTVAELRFPAARPGA